MISVEGTSVDVVTPLHGYHSLGLWRQKSGAVEQQSALSLF